MLMSMTRAEGGRVCTTPAGPNRTCSTCSAKGSIVIAKSASRAASAAEAAGRQPSAAALRTASGSMSWARTRCPPRAKQAAMGRPITPSPMKPISAIILPFRFPPATGAAAGRSNPFWRRPERPKLYP